MSCKSWLNLRPLVKLTALSLILTTLNVYSDDTELDLEIDNIRERLSERLRTQIEERSHRQIRSGVRSSVEVNVNRAINQAITDRINLNISSPSPRLNGAPKEFARSRESRARILGPVDNVDSSLVLDPLINKQFGRVRNQVGLVLETVQDQSSNSTLIDEWLIMTDRITLSRLAKEGYLIENLEELAGLGYMLGTVKAPSSFTPETLASVMVIDDPLVAVDLNHVYLPQRPHDKSSSRPSNVDPKLSLPANAHKNRSLKIGMIDSSIDTSHAVFSSSRITEKAFTPKKGRKSLQHGTAIASILVGDSNQFRGLSPTSDLYNGVVFATDELGREFSTTAAIIRAINWLATIEVKLINMSLAGPDNAILRKAIDSACSLGIIIVTAAGNAGPASKPLYPAAYDCTIAVTAVDDNGEPFHRANRGNHIDFALTGINVRHASSNDSFDESSGTSFAAARLTGVIATTLPQIALSANEIRARLQPLAKDIGETGKDPVFGQGFIQSTETARISE